MNFSLRLTQINRFIFLLPIALISIFCSAFRLGNGKSETRRRPVAREEIMRFRSDITGWAQNFVGTRYRYAGTSPRTGFDCSGFTSYVMREFEVKVSPSSSTQSRQGVSVSLKDVQPGDLVFFGGRRHIQHVAMVVENTAEGIICVHSTNTRGVVIENISTSDYWKRRILFARDVVTPFAETR